MAHFYERHVLSSLAIIKVSGIPSGATLLDVGTGGGFPGVPLAILNPAASFQLIDSTGKKVRVVEHVAQELDLSNVTTQQIRVEELRSQYDYVLGRAVADLPKFVSWVRKNLRVVNQKFSGGIFYLKGGDEQSAPSIKGFQTKVYPLSAYFAEPFFETKYVLHLR